MTNITFQPSPKRTLTRQQVEEYLQRKNVIRWARLGDLLKAGYDACVDGRETTPIVGNPGGDVSRLAEAIISVGQVAGKQFNPGEILKIFDWYVSHFGTFYMHTDEHALTHLAEFLYSGYGAKRLGRKDLRTAKEMYAYVLRPDPDMQVFLSRYLLDARFIGCGHMKLMMQKPAQYGMSEKVLRSLAVAFFDNLWNVPTVSQKLVYRLLKGEHREGAVLTVLIKEKKLSENTWVPMVSPSGGSLSIFVNHPQVVRFLNDKVAYFLAKEGRTLIKDLVVNPQAVVSHLEHLQTEGTRQTVSVLAADLPSYTFVISK